MKTIYKYELPMYGSKTMYQHITKVLKVGTQHNKPVMWAEIDTEARIKEIIIKVYMTGEPQDEDAAYMDYIGTFALNEGAYIGHAYIIMQ